MERMKRIKQVSCYCSPSCQNHLTALLRSLPIPLPLYHLWPLPVLLVCSPFCTLSCAGLVFGFFFFADSSSFFMDQILIMVRSSQGEEGVGGGGGGQGGKCGS